MRAGRLGPRRRLPRAARLRGAGSGVPGWFEEQLGLVYECLSGLPENWILNTRRGEPRSAPRLDLPEPARDGVRARRGAPAPRCGRSHARWTIAAGVVVYAGLLWTHTRAAFLALAAGLVVLALLRRSWVPAALAGGSIVVSLAFVAVFPAIGPETEYTTSELACLRENAADEGEAAGGALSPGESSTQSHWRALRDGVRTVAEHPWGFGLGNAGVSASRTGAEVKAGESTYTELGVDTGVLGLVAFVGWLVALALALRRRSPWLTASVAALAVLGLQTDVIGVHWLSVVVFALGGAALRAAPRTAAPEDAL